MRTESLDENLRWQRSARCRNPSFGPLFDSARQRTMNAPNGSAWTAPSSADDSSLRCEPTNHSEYGAA